MQPSLTAELITNLPVSSSLNPGQAVGLGGRLKSGIGLMGKNALKSKTEVKQMLRPRQMERRKWAEKKLLRKEQGRPVHLELPVWRGCGNPASSHSNTSDCKKSSQLQPLPIVYWNLYAIRV